jgi:zinc protease
MKLNYQYNSEIAGQYILNVVAFDKTELNAVMTGINEAFKTLKAKVFRNGLDQRGGKLLFYNGLSSVWERISVSPI